MSRRKRKTRAPNGHARPYQRQDGQWVIAIRFRGKRYVRYGTSPEVVQQKRDQLLLQLQGGLWHANPESLLTVEACVHGFIAGDFLPVTQALYRSCYLHIAPALGFRPLHQVTSVEIAAWVKSLDQVGSRMRQMAFDLLRKSLSQAVKQGLLSANPCTGVDRPKHKTKKIRAFQPHEVEQILAGSHDHRLGGAFYLIFLLGMRQGEVFGLKWSDIDWQQSILSVRTGAARTPAGGIELRGTKTAASQREIPLPEPVLRALLRRAVVAAPEGPQVIDSELIFPTRRGQPTGTSGFAVRIWKPLLAKLGLESRGLHSGRHTSATLLLRRGVPLHMVAMILGHADPTTTGRTYSHVLLGDAHAAITSLSESLSYKMATGDTPVAINP